jgi:hypothetical protein
VDGAPLPAAGGVNGASGIPTRGPGSNGHAGNGVPPTIGGATRADLAGPPPSPPPFGAPTQQRQQFGGPATGPYGLPAAGQQPEERTPIFEQLQSEWFRQRPTSRPPGEPDGPVPTAADGARPAAVDDARPEAPARPVAPVAPDPQPAAARAPVPGPVPEPAVAAGDPWASPADEGWRAAERLLQPTSGGTTRAGLPMRVPQAHLMPGGADVPPPPPAPGPPAYRSPEAVRSRLASYHQGVRRGRHADRADDAGGSATGERDPSEVLVQQSQEHS